LVTTLFASTTPKIGNKIIGNRDTVPICRPLFVHKVTKKAISPISLDCVSLNENIARKYRNRPTITAMIINL
jgi:hypothetical protein